jgi:hypothetical protein
VIWRIFAYTLKPALLLVFGKCYPSTSINNIVLIYTVMPLAMVCTSSGVHLDFYNKKFIEKLSNIKVYQANYAIRFFCQTIMFSALIFLLCVIISRSILFSIVFLSLYLAEKVFDESQRYYVFSKRWTNVVGIQLKLIVLPLFFSLFISELNPALSINLTIPFFFSISMVCICIQYRKYVNSILYNLAAHSIRRLTIQSPLGFFTKSLSTILNSENKFYLLLSIFVGFIGQSNRLVGLQIDSSFYGNSQILGIYLITSTATIVNLLIGAALITPNRVELATPKIKSLKLTRKLSMLILVFTSASTLILLLALFALPISSTFDPKMIGFTLYSLVFVAISAINNLLSEPLHYCFTNIEIFRMMLFPYSLSILIVVAALNSGNISLSAASSLAAAVICILCKYIMLDNKISSHI